MFLAMFYMASAIQVAEQELDLVSSHGERSACQECLVTTAVTANIVIDSTVYILNCEDIVSADGAAAANSAWVSQSNEYVAGSPCEPHEGDHASFIDLLVDPGDPDSGVMIDRFLQVASAVKNKISECVASSSFTAQLRDEIIGEEPCRIETHGTSCLMLAQEDSYAVSDGYYSWRYSTIEHAAGFIDAGIVIEMSAPLEALVEIAIFAESEFDALNSCSFVPSGSHFDEGVTSTEAVGEIIEVTVIHVPSGLVQTAAGIVAVNTDGEFRTLGAAGDPAISISPTATGYSMAGTATFSMQFGAGGEYSIGSRTRSFGAVLGDFDISGSVDYNDYYAVDAAIGAVWGDQNYSAPIDFDVDGTISTGEVAKAERLLDILLCPVDWDLNGQLNIFDINAFTSAYSAGDLSADWDRNGQLNVFDMTTFVSDYNAGCP